MELSYDKHTGKQPQRSVILGKLLDKLTTITLHGSTQITSFFTKSPGEEIFRKRKVSTGVYYPKTCRNSVHGNSSHQEII